MSHPQQPDISTTLTLENIPESHIAEYPEDHALIFLSDVHLGSHKHQTDQQLQSKIIQLLQYCKANKSLLVILGDLFDYWMEYPGWHPPLGDKMLEAFKTYHESQPSTLYITGNHDHWHLGYLDEIGFHLEDEYKLLKIGQKRVFATHGDGLADPKWGLSRSLFNRLLRSPRFIKLFRTIFAPEVGLSVMKKISRFNKKFEFEQKKRQTNHLNNWASSLLLEDLFDAVVCGHNHNPQIESFNNGIFLNPGPFGNRNSLGWYFQDSFKLMRWNQDNRKLTVINQN